MTFAAAGGLSTAIAAGPDSARQASASRASSAPTIDGELDDPAWVGAPRINDFWQRDPDEGAPPRHQTEFRVLYDDRAVYIGIWCLDDEPEAIRSMLTRRDESSPSDWIEVAIDSYHDKRTAFVFALNPAGVQRDFLVFNDTQRDDSWDAVWTAAAQVNGIGWTAEFRIPFSQLRFSPETDQTWGLQVTRTVARDNERTVWAPWPKSSSQWVSLFGEVSGIENITPPRRMEILPYAVTGLTMADVDADDPFADEFDPEGNLGLDFEYGLGNNFTLSGTVNPDFGQVEADPSEVNLSANESFFAEKRPFFLEGSDIFAFRLGEGGGGSEQLFYSRRIGASPYGTRQGIAGDVTDVLGGYSAEPNLTTIYGATKLSGKTAGGWSIGVLDAVTARETATIQYNSESGDSRQVSHVVQPLTNYGLLRLKKDFNDGRSSFGGVLTSVNRAMGDSDFDCQAVRMTSAVSAEDCAGITNLDDLIHDQAYTGGLRLSHRFPGDRYSLSARLVGSYVHGTAEAIDETLRAPQRYFQRPDADHLDYKGFDPDRTSLMGTGFLWSAGKYGGDHWRFGAGGDVRSPGLEVNDLGFQRDADGMIHWLWGQYVDNEPGEYLRNYGVNIDTWVTSNTAPDLVVAGAAFNAWLTTSDYWDFWVGTSTDQNRRDNGALRGGPSMRGVSMYNAWMGGSSDSRRRLRGRVSAAVGGSPESGSIGYVLDTNVVVQAMTNLDISVGPFVTLRRVDDQFVTESIEQVEADPGDPDGGLRDQAHHILAHIDQNTVGMTMRVNYTFRPNLSFQLYAQPFASTGKYDDYKVVENPQAENYADRFHIFQRAEASRVGDTYFVDRDRDGNAEYSFDRADFNFRQLRTNMVLRWEYLPGSTLFAVWSHERSSSDETGVFGLDTELDALADEPGEHVFLLKLNYWYAL